MRRSRFSAEQIIGILRGPACPSLAPGSPPSRTLRAAARRLAEAGGPSLTAAAREAHGGSGRGRKAALGRTEKRDQDGALQPGGLYF